MNNFAALTFELSYQLQLMSLVALYSLLGLFLMILSVYIFNAIFKLDLNKELVKDQNRAIGSMIGGLLIAVGLIIAASIAS